LNKKRLHKIADTPYPGHGHLYVGGFAVAKNFHIGFGAIQIFIDPDFGAVSGGFPSRLSRIALNIQARAFS
jgi:hypothetical protein